MRGASSIGVATGAEPRKGLLRTEAQTRRDNGRAMSQNAETIERFFAALRRSDFDDALNYLHPEAEIRPALAGEMDIGRRYRGHAEVLRLFETLLLTEGVEMTVKPEAIAEIADGRVLRVELWQIRGQQDIHTEVVLTHIYTFRDRLITGMEGFRDEAEARKAAGLSE